MFTKLGSNGQFTMVVAYVDDLLLTGSSLSEIKYVKQSLHSAFTIKDLGSLKYFLGNEVQRSESGILLNQRKYILDLLKDADMENCNSVSTPSPPSLHLTDKDGEYLTDPESYRRIISKLLYLNMTRPNISYVVQQLSRFLHAPVFLILLQQFMC